MNPIKKMYRSTRQFFQPYWEPKGSQDLEELTETPLPPSYTDILRGKIIRSMLDNNIPIGGNGIHIDLKNGKIIVENTHNLVFDNSLYQKIQNILANNLDEKYRLEFLHTLSVTPNGEFVYIIESNKSKRLRPDWTSIEPVVQKFTGGKFQIPMQIGYLWEPQKKPHSVISGGTGSGKSMLLLWLIYQTKSRGSLLYFIDPKLSDLYALGNQLESQYLATDGESVIKMLQHLMGLMHERQKEVTKHSNGESTDAFKLGMQPIFLFYDETAALISSLDSKQKKEYDSLLKQLILKGRSAGINIVFAMQQPNAQNLSTEIRENTSLKILLGSPNPQSKQMLFGSGTNNLQITSSDSSIEVSTFNSPEQTTLVDKRGTGIYADTTMNDPRYFESPDMTGFNINKHLLPLFKDQMPKEKVNSWEMQLSTDITITKGLD